MKNLNLKKSFGKNLKILRKKNGLTQKKLALIIGVGQTTIANYEKEIRFPDELILKKISKYFNISLDFLLDIDIKENNSYINPIIAYKEYRQLLMKNNFNKALSSILKFQKMGLSLQSIFLDIFIPMLQNLGILWEQNNLSIAQEHIISNQIEKTIHILSQNEEFTESKKIKCVCATAGSEKHNLVLLMISYLLSNYGIQTFYLGSNVPTKDLIDFCKSTQANVLLLSVTLNSHLDSVVNIVKSVRSESKLSNCNVIIGGPDFISDKNCVEKIKADYYANTIMDVMDLFNASPKLFL